MSDIEKKEEKVEIIPKEEEKKEKTQPKKSEKKSTPNKKKVDPNKIMTTQEICNELKTHKYYRTWVNKRFKGEEYTYKEWLELLKEIL